MGFKTRPAFQAVAVSDHGGAPKEPRRQFYVPTATRAPFLVALLCSILACIALLEVVVSNSVNKHNASSSLSALSKRQVFTSVTTYSDLTGTSAGITETFSGTTFTVSSTTFTYPAATFIRPGIAVTVSESIYTGYYLSTTISGVLTIVPVSIVSEVTFVGSETPTGAPVSQISDGPMVYLDTATPSAAWTTITMTITISDTPTVAGHTVASTAVPEAYQSTSTSSVVVPVPTPVPVAYLDTATPSISSSVLSYLYTTPSTGQLSTTLPRTSATMSPAAYLDTATPSVISTGSSYLYTTPSTGQSSTTVSVYLGTPVTSGAYLDTALPSASSNGLSYVYTAPSPDQPSTTLPPTTSNPAAYLDTATPSAFSSPTAQSSTSPTTSSTSEPSSPSQTAYQPGPTPSMTPSALYDTVSSTTDSLTNSPAASLASQVTAQPNITIATSSSPASETIVEVTTLTTTVAPSAAPTSISPDAVVNITALPQTERVVTGKFTMQRYYVATYLCPLVVVLLKCIWGTVVGSIRMTEPFYQLSKPGGGDAKFSLLANYLSSGFALTTLSSSLHRQPIMLLAVTALTITTVMAPIASEAMSIRASTVCPQDDGTFTHCAPVWLLNIPCIRLLQSFLSLLFCLIATYIVLNFKRSSGVFSDPSSIASVGSLLGNQDFVQELRDIPTVSSTKDVRRLLMGNKYRLATFPVEGGNLSYGIVKEASEQSNGYHVTNLQEASTTKSKKSSNSRGYLHDLLLLMLSTGLLAVVLAYYRDGKNDGFNRFFNSDGFGPRFILSFAATILDNRWKHLEKEVRMMQPYRQLYSKPRGTKISTEALLVNTASTTYTSFPIALWRRNYFVALVSFIAVLSDALIIAIVGIPFSYGQLLSSFYVVNWLSVSILSLMIITALLAMLWWRRGNPKGMPRRPDTLVSVALYLCASQVTEQLVPLSLEAEATRNHVVRGWGEGFWFGQGLGVDAKTRWLIDKGDELYEPRKARVGQRYF
ncbi:hypothetical protein H2200_012046 [Cladophialophora chaetospira]|uniref:Uncharacterized protein n=1 Tax=Cladophialophora chaetospira TaxID=386627 RepID=A0AA38WY20_9EURO|nr:hypothetical protein H2200_012046 [Cladophialophora chaetospira]